MGALGVKLDTLELVSIYKRISVYVKQKKPLFL